MSLLDKLLDPQPGDLGAWVTLPDGTTGQVWSPGPKSRVCLVWVADGQRYHLAPVDGLQSVTPDGPEPVGFDFEEEK